MSELPDIIDSKIVTQEANAFWLAEAPGKINAVATVLIISSVYSENEALQLQKILQACTLTNDQYNIIQLEAGDVLAWHKLKHQFEPTVVLLFGILPIQ